MKIKPCPCCGMKAKVKIAELWLTMLGKDAYKVECTGCGLMTAWYKTEKFAAEAWNRRVKDAV